MSFCKNCGTPLEGEPFCNNCGTRQEDSISSVDDGPKNKPNRKNKGRIALLVGGCAIAVLAISYFALGFDEQESLNETELVEEVADSQNMKEVASVEQAEENDKKPTAQLTYQGIDILGSATNGSIMGALHIGSTKEELVNQIGPALIEYEREGESRLDYADATYMLSPKNGLVYSVLLLFDSEHTADYQDIQNVLGNGNGRILVDSGKDSSELYYQSYGSEDSTITFYSETEEGQPIFKLEYSNQSIYSADLSALQEEQPQYLGNIEPIILDIRKEYYAINEQLPTMKKEEISADKIAYRNGQGVVRKVVEKTSEGSAEYYYDGNRNLFFVFQHKGTTEHRFYFDEDQMIRWINPKKVTIDHDAGQSNAEYKEWEKRWLEKAYE